MKRAARGEARAWLDDFISSPPATGQCIRWPFATADNGYGRIEHPAYDTDLVHRIVLTACQGDPPDDAAIAAHLPQVCHEPGCINQRHLRWATQADNQADRVLDRTSNRGRGSQLATSEVLTIARSTARSVEIGEQYGISRQAVADIRSGRTWAWLTGIHQRQEAAST